MSFGSSYHYEKELPKAVEGEHFVKIGRAFEEVRGGYNILVVPISFIGSEDKKIIPDRITFVEPSVTQSDFTDSFNRKLSKFQACFNLRGSFCPENYVLWEGKQGVVKIGKNKKGFLEVLDFKKNPEWREPSESEQAIF